MKRAIRILEWVTTMLSGHLQGWILLLMMILVLVDVTTRYVLANPLSVAEEYGGYMLVGITAMGLAYTWRERGHVRVEFLVKVLPLGVRNVLRLFTIVLALIFAGFMVYAGWELVQFSLMFGTRSGSWTRTPIAYPQIVIIIGSGLLFLQLLAEVVKAIMILGSGEGEVE